MNSTSTELESGSARHAAIARWERAYQAFETPDQEQRKFVSRLRRIGADTWNKQLRVLEVCSGRGTGLRAWHALGFQRIVGVDLSYALVSTYHGSGQCVVGDARSLPIRASSFDVAVVQGGLHHLMSTADVDAALGELRRVVVPDGRVVIVEPWLTPFLRVVHFVCSRPGARRLWKKLDALATMIDEERQTYERWLHAPDQHRRLFQRHLRLEVERVRWGKLVMVGRPRVS